jgi:hypothetical protein
MKFDVKFFFGVNPKQAIALLPGNTITFRVNPEEATMLLIT